LQELADSGIVLRKKPTTISFESIIDRYANPTISDFHNMTELI
jgi:hypothetical protein